jgi:uroporphyrinogen decarboxylase
MNSRERIAATVRFERPDRVPVIPQVFGHAAVLCGAPLGDSLRDGELLARCQLRALERYGHDAVFALMDVNVETEAVGSVLAHRTHGYPSVSTHALSTARPWGQLEIPDPRRAGRMPEQLRAARVLRGEVGDEVLVVGCVVGPMTLATQLTGMQAALYLAIDHPDRFGRLLDFATDVVIRFGVAQIEAGAHLPIVFDPSSSPDVIPPQFYREFVLPRLTRLFEALERAGAASSWLHTAGPTGSILPYYAQARVEIANFDYCVAPDRAISALPRTCLDGNLMSWAFVEATPEEIATASSELLAAFSGRGGFILSSGCEIPPEARPENVAAMVASVRGVDAACRP